MNVDRFDQLADRFEQGFTVAGGLVFAGRPQQGDATVAQVGVDLAAGEAFNR
jgi:hypothetical protein